MTRWKQDLVEYHTGIRPNEFYELKGTQASLERERDQAHVEIDVLKGIREELPPLKWNGCKTDGLAWDLLPLDFLRRIR